MAIWTPHPGKLSLIFLGVGAAALGYGSIWTLPHLRAGQVALSVAGGGVLLVVAAFRLAFLIALRPAVADALFVTPKELRTALGPSPASRRFAGSSSGCSSWPGREGCSCSGSSSGRRERCTRSCRPTPAGW
jgi:hypothetical protein